MFSNLRKALDGKNISMVAFASTLGITEKSVQNKMAGRTEFTLAEIKKTKTGLLPEYEWTYLFAEDGEHGAIS